MNTTTLHIARRFCGPPNSGNGGYVSGLIARHMEQPCQVTLHAPPPLDTDLQLHPHEGGLQLKLGEQLLASARPYTLDLEIPPPPSMQEAEAAQQRFVGISYHDLPGCFVCGTNRDPGDGLRIFTGGVCEHEDQVAALWQPANDLAEADGNVASEYLWAALDCPGFFAVKPVSGMALLGRYSARIEQPVQVGETLIVSAWAITHDGRKHKAGSALFRGNGERVACAEATWISLQR
ncbi:hotdog fold domain-containing protein [Halopseudomonas sp.]|uniref:hotdog fold domain-containing protein n=1 Tax=Halopseudomonas sp. TaxID=2901191 RepID=UPI00356AFD7A